MPSTFTVKRHPRLNVKVLVSFTGDYEGEGLVSNLSLGGCCVNKGYLPVEVTHLLTLQLHGLFQEPPVKVGAAQVRWNNGLSFGVEFIVFDTAERQRLKRYISQIIS